MKDQLFQENNLSPKKWLEMNKTKRMKYWYEKWNLLIWLFWNYSSWVSRRELKIKKN